MTSQLNSVGLLRNEQKNWIKHSSVTEVQRCIEEITNYVGQLCRREVDVFCDPVLSISVSLSLQRMGK
jgi:hypothetical protein